MTNQLIDLPACEKLLDTDDIAAPLDWRELFGLSADTPLPPLELEIGSGNGRYLRRAAETRRDHLFLGIERNLSYSRKARDRMVKYGIGNARILRADATRFLQSHVNDHSIDALHVYFTDPWPKRKHAKRRIFQTPFIETIHRILKSDAPLFIKVDLFWYFEEIFCRFESAPHFIVESCHTETDRNRDLYEITGFEHKALQKKGQYFSLVVRHAI